MVKNKVPYTFVSYQIKSSDYFPNNSVTNELYENI